MELILKVFYHIQCNETSSIYSHDFKILSLCECGAVILHLVAKSTALTALVSFIPNNGKLLILLPYLTLGLVFEDVQ
jgi:hypothetical protein